MALQNNLRSALSKVNVDWWYLFICLTNPSTGLSTKEYNCLHLTSFKFQSLLAKPYMFYCHTKNKTMFIHCNIMWNTLPLDLGCTLSLIFIHLYDASISLPKLKRLCYGSTNCLINWHLDLWIISKFYFYVVIDFKIKVR